MEFRFFDPSAKTDVTHGDLPHWEQANAFYFITWRTADSIPSGVLEKWQTEREAWLWLHGIDGRMDDWQRKLEELPEERIASFTSASPPNGMACSMNATGSASLNRQT